MLPTPSPTPPVEAGSMPLENDFEVIDCTLPPAVLVQEIQTTPAVKQRRISIIESPAFHHIRAFNILPFALPLAPTALTPCKRPVAIAFPISDEEMESCKNLDVALRCIVEARSEVEEETRKEKEVENLPTRRKADQSETAKAIGGMVTTRTAHDQENATWYGERTGDVGSVDAAGVGEEDEDEVTTCTIDEADQEDLDSLYGFSIFDSDHGLSSPSPFHQTDRLPTSPANFPRPPTHLTRALLQV
ncbi:hypothetical protein IAU60_005718 [Kwoniella sp. DSM 27419]